MRIFVTGGTGFVGTEVTRRLVKTGYEVHILSRQSSQNRPALEANIHRHGGDIMEPASLTASIWEMDAVIHMAGIISELDRATFENVHTRGTQNVIAAAKRGGVRRFIHLSSLGTRAVAASRYHQTKWSAEEAVRASGMEWTIFRPSIIYGPRDQFVNRFASIMRRWPVVPLLGRGNVQFQPVAVEQVAEAVVGALKNPQAIGGTYDLCGPERLTLEELIDQIASVMNRKRLKIRIPENLARLQAAMLEFVYPEILHKAPPLNRDQLLMLRESNVGDARAADTLFGLKHPTFLRGISRYLLAG